MTSGPARMSRPVPRLHAVTDDDVLSLPDLAARAGALAAAGPIALHVRSRTREARLLLEIAALFRELGATVFVNDRADLVQAAGAAGLHLPAAGLPLAAARRVVGGAVAVGRSTHTPAAARAAAADGADYVMLGPIWETATHPNRRGLGVAAIAAAQPAVVIAIGGITPPRVRSCVEAGAFGVAAIGALWRAADPGSAARAMLVSLGQEAR